MDQDLDVITDLPSDVFKLSPPKELSNEDRDLIVRNSIVRIWDGAKELGLAPSELSDAATVLDHARTSGTDMWMLLLVRLVTRVARPPPSGEEVEMRNADEDAVSEIDTHQDRLRQTLCDYVMGDFGARYKFVFLLVNWLAHLSLNARVRLATTWMNEEWYNDQIRLASNPDWVQVVQHVA